MFQATSRQLKSLGLTGPAFLVDERRARANIARMAAKARRSGVAFRPHFKTHQSTRIGGWFADAGVDRITVSSVPMAEKFAEAGWLDITLGILLNPLEEARLRGLADYLTGRGGRLGVTLDSAAAGSVAARLDADVWVKIDTGYGRTGVRWDDTPNLAALTGGAVGLLTHAGQSYGVRDGQGLPALWAETVARLQAAREAAGRPDLKLSVGDTPCCCAVEGFTGVDEVRPGNFVFGDLMQVQIGSMTADTVAAAAVLPVVGVYPDRGQVVLHGGAVHLSKEGLAEEGRTIFGKLGTLDPAGDLGAVVDAAPLVSLSQEHGVVEVPAGHDIAVGDLALVWPVHSCLTCDLLEDRLILEGSP
jgi:D-serine deaminase-like pyridoxal phosphate-dependent protein